jgi:2-dehydropantoate 2-reductase
MDAIKANGLKVIGREEFVVRDNLSCLTHPDQVDGDIDCYILLTKQKGMSAALKDAGVLLDRIGVALTLQNGVGKEVQLVAAFGADRVIGGSIMEGGTLLEPGLVNNHVTSEFTAYFGELNGGTSERTEVLASAFSDAGLPAKAAEDIEHVLWEKVVQVGGASAWGASTLPGNPELAFGSGLSCPEGAAHYVTIAKELLAVYSALGYQPQNFFAPVSFLKQINEMEFDEAVEHCLKIGELFKGRGGVRTSMHEDILAGRKTEVDAVILPLVEQAKRREVDAPTLLGAYRVIKTLDNFCT